MSCMKRDFFESIPMPSMRCSGEFVEVRRGLESKMYLLQRCYDCKYYDHDIKIFEICDEVKNMEEDKKEVNFGEHCKTCRFEKRPETAHPCRLCLDEPTNYYTDKPVYWEKKK